MNRKDDVFFVFPAIIFTKCTNTLTKEAKKTFNCEWDKYYTVTFAWLFWAYTIEYTP